MCLSILSYTVNMYTIYLVEDDKKIRYELKELLVRYGFACIAEDKFENIPGKALSCGCDLVLLDINLPKYDGFYICREIRKSSSLPIIMVTSRDSDMDELLSINMGADDYITKPYNPQILLARMDNLLKRAYNADSSAVLSHEGLSVDMPSGTVSYGGITAELTKNELNIMCMLLKNAGKIVSRNELIDALWHTDEFIDDNTLTVNINRLRAKLGDIGAQGYIKTRRGQGYCI